jgi:hypothetical protein
MESQLKFAAIDIGSNAVRLLLSGVFEEAHSASFRKMSLIRMPIRLGDDAFTQKCISDSKVSQLVKSMIGFKHLIEAFQPLDYMACATSAMREAENGPEICKGIIRNDFYRLEVKISTQRFNIPIFQAAHHGSGRLYHGRAHWRSLFQNYAGCHIPGCDECL